MSENQSPADSEGGGPLPTRSSLRRRLLSGLVVLAIIALVALGLALFTDPGRAAWRWAVEQVQYSGLHKAEQEAAEALNKRHVLVIQGPPPDRPVTSVNFAGQSFDEATEQQLAALYRVQFINLDGCKLSDDQLRCLEGLSQLTGLVLQNTGITDVAIEHVRSLTALNSLQLSGTKVTDAGLARLAPLHGLMMLNLASTKVTDKGLPHLANFPQLRWLVLTDDPITDAGITQLSALPKLDRLSIQGTQVSRQGLARLKNAKPNLHVDY